MSHTNQIIHAAVILANEKLAKDLETHPRARPFKWNEPVRRGGAYHVDLRREGELFSGAYVVSRRGETLHMTWRDDHGSYARVSGFVTIEFVVKQLLSVHLPDEV
jgi:hypothetical protein